MGSDTHDKQELDAGIPGQADLLVADSISQCLLRGEIHQALIAGAIAATDVVELVKGVKRGQSPFIKRGQSPIPTPSLPTRISMPSRASPSPLALPARRSLSTQRKKLQPRWPKTTTPNYRAAPDKQNG